MFIKQININQSSKLRVNQVPPKELDSLDIFSSDQASFSQIL